MVEYLENSKVGRLFPTESVQVAAALRAAGHKIHEYRISPEGRLVFIFPMVDPDTKKSVGDTRKDYSNNSLKVDAKTLIDTWMELRDMIRNKEFILGASEAKPKRSRGEPSPDVG